MRRALILAYSLASYAFFLGVFLYAIAFIGGFPVPTTVDAGGPSAPLATALGVNALLLGVFALQHSVMARPAFKRWWTQFVPKPAERATYVLASSVAFVALFAWWHPIDTVVWDFQDEGARGITTIAYLAGWALLLYATTLIDHFDLFGVRQAWLHWKGTEHRKSLFVTPALYGNVRHPIYVAWIVIFWATPTMTVGHLLLAGMTTAYILVAIRLEERDLVDEFGDTYRRYQQRTPMLIPRMPEAWRADYRTDCW